MSESQGKIGRKRAPRVHITYDVETGGENETKSLPFVSGVISDLSGSRRYGAGEYKERSFVAIDQENFDEVLDAMQPTLDLKVEDKISGKEDSNMAVELDFHAMSDFNPEKVIKQVPALRKLLEARSKLNDLAAKLDGNDKLNEVLSDVLKNSDQRTTLAEEVKKTKKDQE